jgi:hypothetical protein
VFRVSHFAFVSDFEIRASDFIHASPKSISRCHRRSQENVPDWHGCFDPKHEARANLRKTFASGIAFGHLDSGKTWLEDLRQKLTKAEGNAKLEAAQG